MKFTLYVSLLLSMFCSNALFANETDSIIVVKKIIKTIEIDDDGQAVVDSTVVIEDVENVNVFVTRVPYATNDSKIIRKQHKNGEDSFIWNDELEEEYNITIETIDGDSSKVIVMDLPNLKKKFMVNGEQRKHQMIVFENDEDIIFPSEEFIQTVKPQVIDLNDPDIVSFERKALRNGNEKITIIRKGQKE